MSLLYQQREQVLLQGDDHAAPPCFYGSPEQTNKTLALKWLFFMRLMATMVSPSYSEKKGEQREIQSDAICTLSLHSTEQPNIQFFSLSQAVSSDLMRLYRLFLASS